MHDFLNIQREYILPVVYSVEQQGYKNCVVPNVDLINHKYSRTAKFLSINSNTASLHTTLHKFFTKTNISIPGTKMLITNVLTNYLSSVVYCHSTWRQKQNKMR